MLNLCRPDIIDKYKEYTDVHNFFRKQGWFKKGIYATASDDIYIYNVYEFPCAGVVDSTYKAMGLNFSSIWGDMENEYSINGSKEMSESRYMVSSVYLKKYNYNNDVEIEWDELVEWGYWDYQVLLGR